jgi:hypothetical protein
VAWEAVAEVQTSANVEVTPRGWLQPEHVDSTQNLSIGVYDRGGWYTGAGGNLIWSGTINGAFDGDPKTAAILNASRGRITVDLGAAYPVDRVRFYPRDTFPLRFIRGFQLYVNDGRMPPDVSGMDMWTLANVTVQGTATCLIDWKLLYERRENLATEVDLTFPRQRVRYVQVTDLETATWEFAELEVYGNGYVGQATFVTKVLDLGEPADFGDLAWEVEMDPGTDLVLRSRSGSTSDPFLYYRLTGIGPSGQTRVVDANGNGTAWDEYDKLRDDRGAMTLDTEHWSSWSSPYTVAAGTAPMASPGPRRYVQFQVEFGAGNTFEDGVRLHSLSLDYSRPPLAEQVVGEIAPTTVSPGEVTTFTYALAARFGAGHRGFNAIAISTPVVIDPASVRDVKVGGVPAAFTVSAQTEELVLHLSRRVGRPEEVVTFSFDCPVFVPGTRFTGGVFDDKAQGVRQQIVSGDASTEVGTSELAVGWSLTGLLLADAVIPKVVTPNGDGANDAATVSVSVLQVLGAASVAVRIYDLAGQLVWETIAPHGSGPISVVWGAVDRGGGTVPPGVYVCRVSVEAAAGQDTRTGVIRVAY